MGLNPSAGLLFKVITFAIANKVFENDSGKAELYITVFKRQSIAMWHRNISF